MDEWIKCDDRMPKLDIPVLVWNREYPERIEIGYYDPLFSETGWRCDEFMSIDVEKWMYLPEPPKD